MNATLATRLTPISNTMVRNIFLAIAGSLIVAGAAQVRVPFWPVAMTLQTLAVLVIGGAYGARLGAATLVLYMIEGAIGLPFFTGAKAGIFDAKIAWLPYSNLGYLIGFVLAAWAMGYLAEKGWITSARRMVVAGLGSAALVYLPGLIWLGIWAAVSLQMSAGDATSFSIYKGLVPFIPADIIKAVIAGLGLAGGWSLAKR
ncbi:MAG: biotin transporter BioY [Pseudomonadota bacterium]|nr:biotin transporter BioY [Pseudomonadota bacterium]